MADHTGKNKRFPKDFIRKHRQFGRVDPALWEPPPDDPVERFRMMEAYFQHRAALAVNRVIDSDPDFDFEEFAAKVHLDPEALRSKLRGSSVAKIRELLAWADTLGVDVLPVIDSERDLLP